MTIDKAKLKALAEACNPEWVVDTWWASCDADDEAFAYGPLRKCWPDAAEAKADTRFIAAANPATLLELLAEIERLEGEVRLSKTAIEMAVHDAVGRGVNEYLAVSMERDQLKAENEALRKELEPLGDELEKTELRALKYIHRFTAATDLGRELRVALEAIAALKDPASAAKIAHDALEPFRAHAISKAAAMSKGEQP